MGVLERKIFRIIALALILLGLIFSFSFSLYYYNNILHKKIQQLQSVTVSKKSHILDYFQTLEALLISSSRNKTSIEAIKAFNKSFMALKVDCNLTRLKEHYLHNYLNLVDFEVPNAQKKMEVEAYLPYSKRAQFLQMQYIVKNPNKIGEKDKLLLADTNTSYAREHLRFHTSFKSLRASFGLYDVFLVNRQGDVVYTVYKEKDFATNLVHGPYKNSGLSLAFKAALSLQEKALHFEDFKPYTPSYNLSASFISTPIYEGQTLLGVLIFQMPIERINEIMGFEKAYHEAGLGKSGESYLVGSDFLMRNDSRFISQIQDTLVQEHNTTIGLMTLKTEAVKAALKGESNAQIITDYRGVKVLSSYAPVSIFNQTRWAIMSEIDKAEALEDLTWILLASFMFIALFLYLSKLMMHRYLKDNMIDPLLVLKDEMIKIKQSEVYVYTQAIKRDDEIGEIEEAFESLILKLSQALDDAQQSARAKAEFLANMSHEIRTPMNAIIGFASILQPKIKDEKEKRYIDSIERSSKALLQIINDVLDLSKIESGKFELDKQLCDFKELFLGIKEMFIFKVQEKSIELNIEMDEKIPTYLIVDETRLRQVLVNLMGNAIKFTKEGSVSVYIRLLEKREDSIDIEIGVKDTGIGIPQNEQSRVFEAFTQKEGQDNRAYGGTGLGLTISQHLIGLMGSSLSLESEYGEGSCFSFKLNNLKYEHKIEDEDAIEANFSHFRTGSILVVDDISTNRLLVQALFDESGVSITEAVNGQECLDILEKESFDLVLMDIQMPVMDGFEALKKIRLQEAFKALPVIALTASVLDEDRYKINQAGFDAYVKKPIEDTLLYTQVKKYLP